MNPATVPLHAAEPLERALGRIVGQRLRLLVVGDVVVDCYLHGQSRRLSREAPVPIVDIDREVRYPGAAANVMCNLRALGAEVVAGTIVGVDRAGTSLRRMLAERGIGTASLVAEPGRRTRIKERIVVRGQHLARFDRGARGPISLDAENRLFEAIQLLEGIDMTLVCDHQEGVVSRRVMEWLTRWCNRRGIPVCVDPEGNDPTLYRGATLIKPSREETLRLTGVDVTDAASGQAAADRLREATGAKYVVLTLDEDGLVAFGDRALRLPTRATEVREVSGAGDTLFATLTYAMAAGLTFEQATELSATAAAIAVSQPGLSTVTLQELLDAHQRSTREAATAAGPPAERRALSIHVGDGSHAGGGLTGDGSQMGGSHMGGGGSLTGEGSDRDGRSGAAPDAAAAAGRQLSIEAAEQLAERLRREGRRIVFTNGCFDLIHRGHVEYLAASRKLGDVLIVGVNSDDSVRRLKGPERPIVSQGNRLQVLSTLRSVDYVVLFDSDTPVELIRRIRPDVLTKGGDYLGQQVPGAEYAGQLHLIPYIDGCSTTLAIDRIRKAA